jgi:hypothetical protein
MHKFLWIVLLAGASLSQPSMATSSEIIKPGLWEITTTMEIPGVPFQSPPQTVRHCVTQQDAEDIEKSLPIRKDCKIIDLRSSANKINWKVECTGEMAGKGEGEVEYKGDSSYEGKTMIQTQGMTFNMKHKGKLVGKCL